MKHVAILAFENPLYAQISSKAFIWHHTITISSPEMQNWQMHNTCCFQVFIFSTIWAMKLCGINETFLLEINFNSISSPHLLNICNLSIKPQMDARKSYFSWFSQYSRRSSRIPYPIPCDPIGVNPIWRAR